jgi:hypothetical protein
MPPTPERSALALFLPDGTLDFFDIVASERSPQELHLTLEEKNHPPLEARHQDLPVESKGFTNISITDYPVRGRKTLLTFRRRRWQVGNEVLKRKIDLCAPGTHLEREFAAFLKDDG